MRSLIARSAWFLGGAIAALALLEAVLRLLPVATPLHRTEDAARWPLQNTAPRQSYTYSISWALLNARRGVTNNYGHLAPFDYRRESHPLVVIGDSYIESEMNDYDDTLQAQLGDRLGRRESVYGLGVSGLSMSDYVALARLARSEFAPRAAIVLVSDGDIAESLFVRHGAYYLVPTGPGFELGYTPVEGNSLGTRIRKAIGEVSLHRYLQINLQFAPENLLAAFRGARATAPSEAEPARAVAEQKRVAAWFVDEIGRSAGVPPQCVVILMDTDRYAIYRPESASPRKDDPAARRHLAEQARAAGYRVADLEEVFRRRYAVEREKFDHWPIDRHWNRHGHGVAAEEAERLLTVAEGGRAACLAGEVRKP